MAPVAALIEYAEDRTDLDVLAVTDHEDVRGGLEAHELAAKWGYRIDIVPGAEVTTRHGHLLGLFIERTPPSFRSIEATVEDIHSQGGLAVVPHPLSWLTRSVSRRTLKRLLDGEDPAIALDGIELWNPSPVGKLTRGRAEALNRKWNLAVTGGSDAHHLGHVGTGWTEFEGTSARELRAALDTKTSRGGMTAYPPVKDIGYRQVALGLAWGYAATPRKMLRQIIPGKRS